jgi:hypothetical protein
VLFRSAIQTSLVAAAIGGLGAAPQMSNLSTVELRRRPIRRRCSALTQASGVSSSGGFLSKLDAGRQIELRVDVGEVGVDGAR